MADTNKKDLQPLLKSDILTLSPVGSPTWECRSPVGLVLFDMDMPHPGAQDDKKPRQNTESPSLIASKNIGSISPNPSKTAAQDAVAKLPVDIFGNNSNRSEISSDSKCQPGNIFRGNLGSRHDHCPSSHSVGMNDPRLAVKTRAKRSRIPNLNTSKVIIAERKSAIEMQDPSALLDHRRMSHTDHPLKSFNSCTRITTGDAEDLDLVNKLRSALAHGSRRHPSPEKPQKSVRWDPAIVYCGAQSTPLPFVESKSMIEKDQPIELKDCLQTIFSLKKNDRHKVREILDALSRIDSDGDCPVTQDRSKIGKRLNPEAVEFRTHNCSENPNNQNTGLTTQELIWIRSTKPINLLRQPVLPKVSADESRPAKLSIRQYPRPFVQIPAIEIPQGEDGHGREAKKFTDSAWANTLVEKFTAKYPLTGTLKPASASLAKVQQAAVIQQRLEYLLMQKKEKRVLEGKENQSLK